MAVLSLSSCFRTVANVHSKVSMTSDLKSELDDLEVNKMDYDMKRSGEYIKSLRIQNGYTQSELSKAMNIDQSYLSRVESGIKGCSVDLFIQFSNFFHVSLDSLVFGPDADNFQQDERKSQLKADIAELIERLIQFQSEL